MTIIFNCLILGYRKSRPLAQGLHADGLCMKGVVLGSTSYESKGGERENSKNVCK